MRKSYVRMMSSVSGLLSESDTDRIRTPDLDDKEHGDIHMRPRDHRAAHGHFKQQAKKAHRLSVGYKYSEPEKAKEMRKAKKQFKELSQYHKGMAVNKDETTPEHSDWWKGLSSDGKRKYLAAHPNSKHKGE